jgi:hypothetical protein
MQHIRKRKSAEGFSETFCARMTVLGFQDAYTATTKAMTMTTTTTTSAIIQSLELEYNLWGERRGSDCEDETQNLFFWTTRCFCFCFCFCLSYQTKPMRLQVVFTTPPG